MSKFMRLFKNKHKSEVNKENERFSDTFSEDDRRTVHFNEYTDEEMINPYHAPAQPRKYPKGPQSCPGGVQDGSNRKESKRVRGHPSQQYFDEVAPRGSSSHHKQRAVNKYSDDESDDQRHRFERKIENLKRENSSLHEKCQRLEEELERVRRTSTRYRKERNEYRERCQSQRYMSSYMGTCCQPHYAPAPSNHYFPGYSTVPSVPSVFNDTPSTSSHNSMMRGGVPPHGNLYLYPRESLSDLEMNHMKSLTSHRTLSHNESEDDENFLQSVKLSRRASELSGEEAGFSSAPTLTISDQKHKRPQ
uniref:BZIP domain-containing protein n=1 Tax=Steinernema glaseri TaxID=37863 RepID=A0A1I7YTP6_9BILA